MPSVTRRRSRSCSTRAATTATSVKNVGLPAAPDHSLGGTTNRTPPRRTCADALYAADGRLRSYLRVKLRLWAYEWLSAFRGANLARQRGRGHAPEMTSGFEDDRGVQLLCQYPAFHGKSVVGGGQQIHDLDDGVTTPGMPWVCCFTHVSLFANAAKSGTPRGSASARRRASA